MYTDHSPSEIDKLLVLAQQVFYTYKHTSLKNRACFLKNIAQQLELQTEMLVITAHQETNLSEKRLQNELKRTIFQLNNYAEATERGDWLNIKIDTADLQSSPAKPDLRKMNVPIGSALVFGASNFPFAYSTAGGDTACALAAGCPVIVKAHPSHPETSTLVAKAIQTAVKQSGMPEGVFTHIYGSDFKTSEYLVKHPIIKVVGFTGSLSGGRAIYDYAAQRKQPIPVFAEMGSTNPVFLLPNKLADDCHWIAERLMLSITQDMGQFCTNPGLIIGLKSDDLDNFTKLLTLEMHKAIPTKMLSKGIATNYLTKMQTAMMQKHIDVLYQSGNEIKEMDGMIALAKISAKNFLKNTFFAEEVFGPYSLIVECADEAEMQKVAQYLEGQLTITLMGTEHDIQQSPVLINVLQEKCGRMVFNNVPTGVEVCAAMQHGGPYPSCTDSRFTSVGADGILRFVRPMAFQSCENTLLPDELKNENPLGLWRSINNELTKGEVPSAKHILY